MSRTLRILLIFILYFTICNLQFSSFAQKIRNFSPNPTQFFEELRTFMQESYEGGEDIINEFHAIWKIDTLPAKEQELIYKNANKALKKRMKARGDSITFQYGFNTRKLSDKQIKFIHHTSNVMLKKRMKPFPHFKNYLFSLISFITSDQTEKSFTAWQTSLNKLIETATSRKVISYLEICNNLFSENLLYKSSLVKWTASNKNYIFDFDTLPKIVFRKLDLKCYSKRDSAIIYNTSGAYYPSERKWYGKGGKVNWLRAGLKEDMVRAELSTYMIALRSPKYTADSVTFYNKKYFDKPLLGKLTEKIMADVTVKKASYPRFDSYDKRLKITNLVKNVDYDGGFSMRGAKFIGSGSKEEDAYLTFKLYFENDTIKRNQDRFLVVASKNFTIRDDKITSANTAVTIYLENDSIYHSRLKFQLIIKSINDKVLSRKLLLIRGDKGLAQSPYFNSYHKIDMYFEALYWDVDDPRMDFQQLKGVGNISKANFESANYYKESRYLEIMGRDMVHPLVVIRAFDKKNGLTRTFYVDELAAYMRMSSTQVRQQVMHLANMGFLSYDFESDRAHITDKLFDYLNANAGKIDYDVIDFNSVTSGVSNASMNLLNFDLKMNGISRIFLSDSQNVYIYPTNREITLKKNRDFIFAGRVNAGRFDFFGKEFSFEYDKFKINLKNVDSLRLKVPSEELDVYGNYKLVKVKTVIEHIDGELLIDQPYNKSGVKSFPEYPIFNSYKDSYVFYDKGSIQDGVYDKDRFHFHLEPFTIDSLDNFNPAAISLKGTLVSAGIFPDFIDSLGVQPDYSLGFVRPTPLDGFPVYGGKGTYFADINLSHEGLRGDGTLNYLVSTTTSDDFIFFPDSMNTNAQRFEIEKQADPVEYPNVIADSVYVHWLPYEDVMYVYKEQRDMDFYDGEAKMGGTLALQPDGLTGDGQIDFADAELESNLIKFNQWAFDADTADFRMNTEISELEAFSTVNVNAHVDFDERKGVFKSNGEGSYIEFPANQYICYMDQFTWYMDEGSIELSASKTEMAMEQSRDLELEGSKFISTHPKQDSLSFYAIRGKYDIKHNIIYAQEVKLINVADARIYPDAGKVTVRKKANMETLTYAKILANTTTQYHNIYNAEVKINSRKHYVGSGDYDYIYIDERKQKQKQTIHYDKITVDTTGQTYALGEIHDTANFMLSSKFAFTGNVNLMANNEFLNFTGFCKIGHDCEGIISNWFKFSADINPLEIYIPVSAEPINLTNDKLSSGIVLAKDSAYVYSTFLSLKSRKRDIDVLPAEGYLFYDKTSKEYRISNKDKLVEIALPGNYISLNTAYCKVYAEGKINLGENIGQVKLTTVGNAIHNLNDRTAKFDLIMAVDFFFADGALKAMAENISEEPIELLDYDRPTYERGLTELVGKETADKLISEINIYGSYKKVPAELVHTLVLTDLKLKWNPSTGSYVSEGPIGIGNINKKQIHKPVKGIVELLKKRSGDVLSIYLEATEDNWYFFTYQRGLMQAISSSDEFNTIIKELKPDKRKVKAQYKGGMSYQFIISTGRKKKSLLRKFHFGEEEKEAAPSPPAGRSPSAGEGPVLPKVEGGPPTPAGTSTDLPDPDSYREEEGDTTLKKPPALTPIGGGSQPTPAETDSTQTGDVDTGIPLSVTEESEGTPAETDSTQVGSPSGIPDTPGSETTPQNEGEKKDENEDEDEKK